MFRVTLYSDIKCVNISNGLWEFERPSRDWDFVAWRSLKWECSFFADGSHYEAELEWSIIPEG
jgi:hypothetical protein